MSKTKVQAEETSWAEGWLDAVASGRSTMSQRKLESIEEHAGVALVRRPAKARGVHLILLTDEHGNKLVAAQHASISRDLLPRFSARVEAAAARPMSALP